MGRPTTERKRGQPDIQQIGFIGLRLDADKGLLPTTSKNTATEAHGDLFKAWRRNFMTRPNSVSVNHSS